MKKIIAHRGIYDNKKIIENTIEAFTKAINFNIPIELDIWLLKDNNIVIYHDLNLFRLTKNINNITDLTYNELPSYNFKIPLLKDVLNLVNNKVPIYIEVKTYKNKRNTCKILKKILKDYKGKIYIQSFNPYVIKYFNKYYETGLIISDRHYFYFIYKYYLKILNPNYIAISKKLINSRLVSTLNIYLDIYIWTIKNKKELKKYYKKDYYYICNNLPYLN